MKTELDIILQGINTIHYEGIKEVRISVADLLLLRSTILDQKTALTKCNRELNDATAKLVVRALDAPVHFRVYT
jgi:hypothetical protein